MTAGSHNFANLKAHILPLSVADSWEEAKLEWVLDYVEVLEVDESAPPQTCPCGHYPIVEICWIRNQKNNNTTFVGNVCVKRFLGMPAGTIADGLKRIMSDRSKALNLAAIEFAYEQGWITAWENGFCLNTAKKRRLSGKQLRFREDINEKVLKRLRQQRTARRR